MKIKGLEIDAYRGLVFVDPRKLDDRKVLWPIHWFEGPIGEEEVANNSAKHGRRFKS